MGHAQYIGRVAALAVALGVGTAVVSSPTFVWASPATDAGTTNTSPSDTHVNDEGDNTDGNAAGSKTNVEAKADEPAAEKDDPESVGAVKTPHPEPTDETSRPVLESDDTTSGPSPTVDPPAVEPKQPPALPRHDTKASAPFQDRVENSVVHTEQSNVPTPPTTRTVVNDGDLKPTVAQSDLPTVINVVDDGATDRSEVSTFAALSRPASESTPAVVAPSLISIATSLLAAVVSPWAALPGPDAPVDSPVLWAMLAWGRRPEAQSQALIAPTTAPSQPAITLFQFGVVTLTSSGLMAITES